MEDIDAHTDNILQLNAHDHFNRIHMLIDRLWVELGSDKKNMKQIDKDMVVFEQVIKARLKDIQEQASEQCQEMTKTIKSTAQEVRKETGVYSEWLAGISRDISGVDRQAHKEQHRVTRAEGTMGYKYMYQRTGLQSVYQQD